MKTLEKIILNYTDGTKQAIKKDAFVIYVTGEDMDAEFLNGMETEQIKDMLQALLNAI